MIFKLIFCSILSSSLLLGDNGWFPVEKSVKAKEEIEEIDPSIWVLFSKTMGAESFQVKFPEEPSYQYTESGQFIVSSQSEEGIFQLVVQGLGEASSEEEPVLQEHTVQTERHLYRFQAIGSLVDENAFQQFIDSFSIEKNR